MLCWVGSRLLTSARTVLIFDYALPILYKHIYLCFTSISLPPQQAFAGVVTVIAVLVSILLATVTSSLEEVHLWTSFFFLRVLHICILIYMQPCTALTSLCMVRDGTRNARPHGPASRTGP
jgi:hypothetical protein